MAVPDMMSAEEEALWNEELPEDERVPELTEETEETEVEEQEEVLSEEAGSNGETIDGSEEELEIEAETKEPVVGSDSEEVNKEEDGKEPEEQPGEDSTDDEAAKELEQDSKEPIVETFKPLRVDGKDIPIENIDELYTLASKGSDYTKKMQAIAPHRRAISAMQENNVTEEDVSLLIEALGGNENALSAILEKSGIDSINLNDKPSEDYKPEQYGSSESEQEIQNIRDRISLDAEFIITQNVVDKKWDSKSREQLESNPRMIEQLHGHVKDGWYDKVSPLAEKRALMDGNRKSSLEYYMEADKEVYDAEKLKADTVAKAKADIDAKVKADKDAQRTKNKKAAGAPNGKQSGEQNTVVDYINLDADSPEFQKIYDEMMSR